MIKDNYVKLRGIIKGLCILIIAAICFAGIRTLAYARTSAGINKTTLELKQGSRAMLKIRGTDKKVKWTSSNKYIVKVKAKGKQKAQVTAVSDGSAKVTAKAGKKKYTCKVTVFYKGEEMDNTIYIKVGDQTVKAELEDNESAKALRAALKQGELTISASNYGGFEKVCSLGMSLPKNDIKMTTKAGDICLYNGNQIVIFYGSNTWSYTKLGTIYGKTADELKTILSGSETQITLKQ